MRFLSRLTHLPTLPHVNLHPTMLEEFCATASIVLVSFVKEGDAPRARNALSLINSLSMSIPADAPG